MFPPPQASYFAPLVLTRYHSKVEFSSASSSRSWAPEEGKPLINAKKKARRVKKIGKGGLKSLGAVRMRKMEVGTRWGRAMGEERRAEETERSWGQRK